MKILQKLFFTRLLVLFSLCVAVSFSAFAQKDILLYETNFSDWGAMNNNNSSDEVSASGAGAGFVLKGKPKVEPSTSKCGLTNYGNAWFDNSSGFLRTKPFTFVSGGALEIWFCADSDDARTIALTGRPGFAGTVQAATLDVPANPSGEDYTAVWAGASGNNVAKGTSSADKKILDPAKLGVFANGNQVKMGKMTGIYKYIFYFPTGVNETKELELAINKGFSIVYLAVYSGVGTTPYVASTNYAQAPADGHAMQGPASTQTAPVIGTPVNDLINVRAWNITGDVTLSIEGADASKFAFQNPNSDGTLTLSNADALAGINVPIDFATSVQEGVANAVLKISSPEVTQPYYVSLTGITGATGVKKILASESTIPFYTSLIASVSQQFSFAGVSLDCPVTLSFEGTGADRFSVSETTVSAANANAGRTVTITYTGDIEAVEHNAFLVLTGTCASNSPVKIPLYAVTGEITPTMKQVVFETNPAGAAFLNLSLAGPTYLLGSEVTVTVVPEVGYIITGWSENAGSVSKSRTFRIKATTPSPIIVNLTKPVGGCVDCGVDASFVSYVPGAGAVTNNGFTASWSKNPDETSATQYTVTVYGKDKTTPVGTCTAPAGTYHCNISGLTPSTDQEDDFFYYYKVDASNLDPSAADPVPETPITGPVRLQGSVSFTCGEEIN